ncbi:hypothetical protein [Beijerinckia mobilis]|uniref:hypothetical protein n=1 Tax=Beijerinckia mobilis TaxID=231434 RepID=UPI000689520F|nr:hypothetical protein [Beijerinckia mobilis]
MIKAIQAFSRSRFISTKRSAASPMSKLPAIKQQVRFLYLFHAIKALNTGNQPFIVQFVASQHGEGATTIATGFAEAAASQSNKSILFVDCHPSCSFQYRPASLIESFFDDGTIHGAVHKTTDIPCVAMARLSPVEGTFPNIDFDDLSRLFALLKETFSIIVLDCPPPSDAPETLSIARYSDGTVLVVRAETTPQSLVIETKQALERFGAQIIGTVFNQYRSYIPSWLQQRL